MTKNKSNAEACRRWRARHREHVQEYARDRYARDRSEIIARVRAWQEAHPGRRGQRDPAKAVQTTRRWREANPERAAELNRAAQARWREANPERAAEMNRAAQARWRERQRAKRRGQDV
ncbi:MAG: hypothetical protein J0M02_03840 [Planctomycetes bacterium]|nr:hypothetical protein [Planctomycetota bacterium]